MTERHPGSFRDPAGFLFHRDGVLYRQVNDRGLPAYRALMSSGLYDELIGRGLLIPHEEVDVTPAEPGLGSLVIRPDLVPFVSYPYEWCPGQLRDAGEATLEIQRLAIEHGMSLRDASAYNIQFLGGRPVLIDTLSFEPLADGQAWVAYAQYCRHFLAPLALMRYVDVRLGNLSRTEIDGVPLDLASRLLPRRTRFRFGTGVHIHAHARSQQRHAADAGERTRNGGSRVSRTALLGLVDSLRSATSKQRWEPSKSAWRDYYAAAESYSDESARHKEELVAELLADVPAAMVWDLGANTGHFSRIATGATGALAVALEMDPSAVEVHWQHNRREHVSDVLPLLGDLSNPAPAQGWAHRERSSLEQRGPADVVLALALVHHLAIGNNVPLPAVLEWFAQLSPRVLVEWIPKQDPMVQRLLASREDVFDDYDTDSFERAAEQWFTVSRREQVKDSERTLYLLERR